MDYTYWDTFNIGERIIGVGEQDGIDLTGRIGTIVGVNAEFEGYDVDFDEPNTYFHNCSGGARKNHGWFCHWRTISPYGGEATFEVPELTGLLI